MPQALQDRASIFQLEKLVCYHLQVYKSINLFKYVCLTDIIQWYVKWDLLSTRIPPLIWLSNSEKPIKSLVNILAELMLKNTTQDFF